MNTKKIKDKNTNTNNNNNNNTKNIKNNANNTTINNSSSSTKNKDKNTTNNTNTNNNTKNNNNTNTTNNNTKNNTTTTTTTPTTRKGYHFFIVLIMVLAFCLYIKESKPQRKFQILILSFLSLLGFFVTVKLIPIVKEFCKKNGLCGRDINKINDETTEKIPESLGIVVGTVYMVVVIMFQPFFFEMLGEYNAALTSILFMLYLGFGDDVLDLRWSIKISLSFLAVLPLLVCYNGPTNIIVPKPFRPFVGLSIELGYLYHIYMSLIAVFCTNSINIYAGINGLEAAQSLVVAIAVLVHNFLELGGLYEEAHTLSMFLILPFVATTSGLLYYNWYPSQVFVGDSFTYFAGMTLAVTGIMGHFSKTLMLFFLPQLLNFALSIPQLIGIVPCPRHRVPRFNPATGLLENSGNLTLINAYIYLFGPTQEEALVTRLTIFQILCCLIAFAIRYSHTVTDIFYDK